MNSSQETSTCFVAGEQADINSNPADIMDNRSSLDFITELIPKLEILMV